MYAVAVHDDGRGPAVYVAGDFDVAGSVNAQNIARWDGVKWEAAGEGLSDAVRALASFQGDLYAGGDFNWSGTRAMRSIARLGAGETEWTQPGDGVNGSVSSLVAHNGQLFVGGRFSGVGHTTSQNCVAWNGTDWVRVGSFDTPEIRAMTVWDGKIIAAATSTFDRLKQRNIAALVASSWQPLGRVTSYDIYALTVHNGELIAGGDFETIGGVAALGVARWDGTAWAPIGDGTVYSQSWYVRSLASHSGALYAGGRFYPTPRSGFDRVSVEVWPYPSRPLAMLSAGRELLVGGMFTRVGTADSAGDPGEISSFFGRWGCAPCSSDIDDDGVVDFSDYLAYLNLFDSLDPAADLTGDGMVDFSDYLEFLDGYSTGCA